MSVSFKGFKEQVITFKIQGKVEPGTLVKMCESETVEPCASGDEFIGVAVSVNGNIAAVQTGGYIDLPYSGTAPEVGTTSISALSSTQIKNSGDMTVKVIKIDEANSTAGILL